MDASIEAKVSAWQDNVTEPDLVIELDDLCREGNEEKLFDAFYRDLAFGTAGLRGTLGVGTNRMNVYVVAQATQGVADYLNAHYENPTLALARDSRNKGEDFQRVAAGVLAANGIHVYVYPRIEPVPTLSFAVRHLGTSAGTQPGALQRLQGLQRQRRPDHRRGRGRDLREHRQGRPVCRRHHGL